MKSVPYRGGKYTDNDDMVAVVDKYIPDKEEIDVKGRLYPIHPRVLTLIELMPEVWDELKPIDETIQKFVRFFERRMVSVDREDGTSARDEYESILTSGRSNDPKYEYDDPTNMFRPMG